MSRIGGAGELFGTNGVRGIANEELTVEIALNLGRTIAVMRKGKIAIAMDTRISSQMLKNAVIAGILSSGNDVVDLDIAPTPALQYYVKERDVHAGVIITASHNPREYNGIKFVDSDGTEFTREMDEIAERIYKSKDFRIAKWDEIGDVEYDNCIPMYVNGIVEKVDRDGIAKRRLRVVVDCGNGAASFTTPFILKKLGCDVISINCHPDGRFPARNPEPIEENVEELKKIVRMLNADLGIAHDGDADRATFVDEKGNFVSEDVILALMAKYYVERCGGGVVVTPISSSKCVEDVVTKAGGEVVYTAVGSPIVVEIMKKRKAIFGGEGNGGLIFPEHLLARDGGMSVAKIIEIMVEKNKTLSELVSEIPTYHTVKLKVRCDDKKKLLNRLKSEFDDANFIDGARIDYEDGWLLIRPSGTEPIARIFAEAKSKEKAEKLAEFGVKVVKKILGDN